MWIYRQTDRQMDKIVKQIGNTDMQMITGQIEEQNDRYRKCIEDPQIGHDRLYIIYGKQICYIYVYFIQVYYKYSRKQIEGRKLKVLIQNFTENTEEFTIVNKIFKI